MADDELVIEIEKHHWRPAITRALQPVLRSLGDKHGNLVIAARPTQGEILVKGEPSAIEGAKKELTDIITEYFPDAELPAELTGAGATVTVVETTQIHVKEHITIHHKKTGSPKQVAAKSPKQAPAAEPEKEAKASTGLGGRLIGGIKGAASSAASAVYAAPPAPASTPDSTLHPDVTVRKRKLSSHMAPACLLWECTRSNSRFLRKRPNMKPMSAEPCNITSFHAAKYAGLTAESCVDVRPVKHNSKEAIELVQTHAKTSQRFRPKSALVTMGLSKCPEDGLKALDRELLARSYRQDLRHDAKKKYVKVQKSFRVKRPIVKSRRVK